MPLLSKDVWQNGTNDSQQSFLQFYIYLCLPMRPWGSWRLQPECHLLLCVCVCVCVLYITYPVQYGLRLPGLWPVQNKRTK